MHEAQAAWGRVRQVAQVARLQGCKVARLHRFQGFKVRVKGKNKGKSKGKSNIGNRPTSANCGRNGAPEPGQRQQPHTTNGALCGAPSEHQADRGPQKR
jgi:hypothetical protein